MTTVINNVIDLEVPKFDLPEHAEQPVSADAAWNLSEEIKKLLKQKNAVLIAHYYTDAAIQILAEETGGHVSDSLDMARFGYEHPAETLVVAGVRFMGETAKILNPEKHVLMPNLDLASTLNGWNCSGFKSTIKSL